MTIVVDELISTLRQKITIGSKPIMLYAIRPYVYKHLAPAGNLFVRILDANGNKIVDSETIAISSISAINYAHGFYRFLVTAGLAANTSYYIQLMSTGYTYGANSFIGWCRDWEFHNAFPVGYTKIGAFDSPYGLQLWSYDFLRKAA